MNTRKEVAGSADWLIECFAYTVCYFVSIIGSSKLFSSSLCNSFFFHRGNNRGTLISWTEIMKEICMLVLLLALSKEVNYVLTLFTIRLLQRGSSDIRRNLSSQRNRNVGNTCSLFCYHRKKYFLHLFTVHLFTETTEGHQRNLDSWAKMNKGNLCSLFC